VQAHSSRTAPEEDGVVAQDEAVVAGEELHRVQVAWHLVPAPVALPCAAVVSARAQGVGAPVALPCAAVVSARAQGVGALPIRRDPKRIPCDKGTHL